MSRQSETGDRRQRSANCLVCATLAQFSIFFESSIHTIENRCRKKNLNRFDLTEAFDCVELRCLSKPGRSYVGTEMSQGRFAISLEFFISGSNFRIRDRTQPRISADATDQPRFYS